MNIKLAWAIVGLLVVGGLFIGVAPRGMQFGGGMMRTQGAIDQHFIEEMIPHHEGAIQMATLALERSQRPEISAFAHGIIDAQSKEIADMEGWYKAWYGTAVPADTAMGGMGHGAMGNMQGMVGDPSALKNAKDFDKEFLEEMIVHHEMAVMMARMLESGTVRPEMQQLAKNIITSQTAEIAKMHTWLNDWYRQN